MTSTFQFNPQAQLQPQQAQPVQLSSIVATKTGEEFVKIFYETYDKSREEISNFYLPNSILVWNGMKVVGADQIKSSVADLPRTEHEVHTVDAQPSTITVGGTEKTNIVVSVNGTIEYGGDASTKRLFTEYFILVPEMQNGQTVTYIASDTYRWICPIVERAQRPGPGAAAGAAGPHKQKTKQFGGPGKKGLMPKGPQGGRGAGFHPGNNAGPGGRGRGFGFQG